MADISVGREEKVWVRAAATQAAEVSAFESGDAVYHIGSADFNQQITLLDNEEKRNSRTRLPPQAERYPPGSWSYQTYLKPASTPLAAPEAAALYLAAFGTQVTKPHTRVRATGLSTPATVTSFYVTHTGNRTNTAILVKKGGASAGAARYWEEAWVVSMAATNSARRKVTISPALGTAPANSATVIGSVTYQLIATSPAAVGMLLNRGHSVFRIAGCTVNQVEFNVGGEGFATASWSGEYMKGFYTGSDALAATIIATATKAKVAGNPYRFMKGSILKIESEIITIGSDQLSNATVTIIGLQRAKKGTSATTHITGRAITPWTPATTVITAQGRPVPGYRGYLEMNGTKLIVTGATVTLNNNSKMAVGEKNDQLYVQSFSNPGFREVTGSLDCYFRTANLVHFRDAQDSVQKEMNLPVGSPSQGQGKLVAIQLRQMMLSTPALSGDEEVSEAIDWRGFGAAASDNDEIRIAFL